MNKEIGIYIHIPFCKKKCYYCDFVSFPNCNNEIIVRYVEDLKKEIEYGARKTLELFKQNNENVEIISDDSFVMPEEDVTLKATWTRQNIDKTMDGTVNGKATLYKTVERDAKTDLHAKKYTGNGSDNYENNGNMKPKIIMLSLQISAGKWLEQLILVE